MTGEKAEVERAVKQRRCCGRTFLNHFSQYWNVACQCASYLSAMPHLEPFCQLDQSILVFRAIVL